MGSRTVPTWLLVGLALLAGGAAGVLAGRHWAAWSARAAWHRARRNVVDVAARAHDPAGWRRDSAARAAREAAAFAAFARRGREVPLEVRREQVSRHCALSYAIRDTAYRGATLFHVRAENARRVGVTLAEAWAYRPGGWGPGDTVTVVVPDVWCGRLLVFPSGSSAVAPPEPLRIDLR